MALSGIYQYTRATLVTEIRRIVGDIDASGLTPEIPDLRIQSLISDYLQSLLAQVAEVQQEAGQSLGDPVRGLSMYSKTGTLTTTISSSTVSFPVDFSHLVSAWDTLNNRAIRTILSEKDFTLPSTYKEWREKPPGPPQAIVVRGFAVVGSTFVRQGELLPATESGVTPSISIEYYRMANAMGADTDSPDIDPKYQRLAVVGPVIRLLQPDSPLASIYEREEKMLLRQLAREENQRRM